MRGIRYTYRKKVRAMPQSQWIEAVTDRTAGDVQRVRELHKKGWKALSSEERAEWIAGMKGALNLQDLERIENNIQVLSELLELKTGAELRGIPEIPNTAYFSKLLSDVGMIREAYCIHENTPHVPQMPLNDYQKINETERILFDVYDIFNHNYHYFCGEDLYAGEETGLLL